MFSLSFLWPMLSALASFIVILSPLIFIHELGHYWMAKWHGIHVEEFSIGMGPRIFSWTDRSGTKWSLSWFLIGGYVRMLGDGDAASSTSVDVSPQDKNRTMAGKTPWQRIQVALAGPAANYLLAFILWMGLLMTVGKSWHQPVIQMDSTAYAYRMGLRSDDRIVGIRPQSQTNVLPIKSFERLLQILSENPANESLVFQVQRDHQSMQIPLSPPPHATGTWLGKLGIRPAPLPTSQTISSASEAWDYTLSAINPLTIIKNFQISAMGGPIAIAKNTQDIWQADWSHALFLMATLSVGLGFFNLLPLPILDGGLVFLELVQLCIRRPLSPLLRHYLSLGAALIVGGLMLVLSWQDILRIPSVAKLLGL